MNSLNLSYLNFFEDGGDFNQLLYEGVAEKNEERKREIQCEANDLLDRQLDNKQQMNHIVSQIIGKDIGEKKAQEKVEELQQRVTKMRRLVDTGEAAVEEAKRTITQRSRIVASLKEDLKRLEDAERQEGDGLDGVSNQLGTRIAQGNMPHRELQNKMNHRNQFNL